MLNRENTNTDDKDILSDNRLYVGILLLAATASIAAVIYYAQYFPGKISDDHQQWGTFGDFFGGVLNPFFAFLALMALLYTIKLQVREIHETRVELKKTADATEAQLAHLKLETEREDVHRTIKAVFNDIMFLYEKTTLVNLVSKSLSGEQEPKANTTLRKIIENLSVQDDYTFVFEASYKNKGCNLCSVVTDIEFQFMFLVSYLRVYDGLGSNVTSGYYRARLSLLISYLQENGVIKEDDVLSSIVDRFHHCYEITMGVNTGDISRME